MWFHSLFASMKSGLSRSRRPQPRPARRATRLFVEQLEDRALPSAYTALTASDLIADINAANTAGGANTITLTAPTTSPYALTGVNNTTNGGNYLPVIAANDNLTIIGNGDTIRPGGGPGFRLLEVASGASLTLGNLTLQGGYATEGGAIYSQGTLVLNGVTVQGALAEVGGAIYSQGTLVLNGSTVQGNLAENFDVGDAAGGGIFSRGGSVTLEGGTIVQNNTAYGATNYGGYGGNAFGGGLCAIGGTVTVTNATLDNNYAVAGLGQELRRQDGYAEGGGLYASGATLTLTNATLDGNVAELPEQNTFGGGGAFGGGLYLTQDTWGGPPTQDIATLTNCTVQGNSALGGGKYGSPGEGGGLFIYRGAVSLDAATVKHVNGNTASSGSKYDNIVGPYTRT